MWSEPRFASMEAIGSLLEPWFWKTCRPEQYTGVIWGTGRMFGSDAIKFPKAEILAVRGKFTQESLGTNCPVGDPGLLAPVLKSEVPTLQQRFAVGVIPHWTQRHAPQVRRLARVSNKVKIIDPCAGVRQVLEDILRCDVVLSSAMHGLIVADSFGIPNRRIRLGTGRDAAAGMPNFKFNDYYSVVNATSPNPVLTQATSVDELVGLASHYAAPEVRSIQAELLKSLQHFR